MANRYFCRFPNVTIVNGADIRNCFVRFVAYDGELTDDIQLNCYFVDEDDPAAPVDKAELDGLNLTSGIAWDNLPAWQDGIEYQTPDLSTLLEAVVGRAGWESGNAVILVIEDDSSPSDVHRKISAEEYLWGTERPSLNVGWYSTVESFFANTRWQPDQLDPATGIETSWDGTKWNFNIAADSDGGRLVVRGTWHLNYQPGWMVIKHTHGGTPELKVYAADGLIYHSLGYTSEDIIIPLWAGRSEGIYAFEFILAAGDNTPFTVTDITFNSITAAGMTTTSTSSTISTTSSTSSTASTVSTISTTSSTTSTISTISSTSTTSSTSSTASSTSSSSSTYTSSSTATTRSTYSTFSTTHTTVTTTTASTASGCTTTMSTTSSSSSTTSTASTISTTSSTSTTASTESGSTTTSTSTSTSTSSTASTLSTTSSSSTSTTTSTSTSSSTSSTTTSTSTSTSTSSTASTLSTTSSTSTSSSTSSTISTTTTTEPGATTHSTTTSSSSTTTSTSTSTSTSSTASTLSTTTSTSSTASTLSTTTSTSSSSTTTSTSTSSSTSSTASTLSTTTSTSSSSSTASSTSTTGTTSTSGTPWTCPTGYGPDVVIKATGDVTGGFTFTESGYHQAGLEWWHCFDNDPTGGRWTFPFATSVQWGKVELDITRTVNKLRIYTNTGFQNNAIEDFKLQGSNNDSDWDDLLSVTGWVAPSGAWTEWEFYNETAYLYYKVDVTDVKTPASWTYVWEVELRECGGTTTTTTSTSSSTSTSSTTSSSTSTSSTTSSSTSSTATTATTATGDVIWKDEDVIWEDEDVIWE